MMETAPDAPLASVHVTTLTPSPLLWNTATVVPCPPIIEPLPDVTAHVYGANAPSGSVVETVEVLLPSGIDAGDAVRVSEYVAAVCLIEAYPSLPY